MTNGFSINLAVIFVIILKSISKSECTIRCYKCLATLPPYYTNETIKLCKDFDFSEKFMVDCPYSTYCMKRFTTAKIPTAINGTERDCASQKHVIQNYKNGQWHQEIEVEEPYTPGCHLVNDKGARTSTIENCYCNTELCNSSISHSHFELAGFFMAVIVFMMF